MRLALLVLPLVLAVAGCKSAAVTIFQPAPQLTPVGDGLVVERVDFPASFSAPERRTFHSLWGSNNNSLFRDLRARKVGDTVTINIRIDDKASFDNQSDRSREASVNAGLGADIGFGGFGVDAQAGNASIDFDASHGSASAAKGKINRSEKLQLSIAAVVAEVLTDGNLVISGSQEIRVNNEIRVLNIAGIVRPLDISAENTISYEKIAEARISYGGRGRLTAVQQ